MGIFDNIRAKKKMEENPALRLARNQNAATYLVPLCDECAHSDRAHANGMGECSRCDCKRMVLEAA